MENKSTKRQKTAKNMHKDSKKRAVVMTMKNRYCDSSFSLLLMSLTRFERATPALGDGPSAYIPYQQG